MPAKTPTTTAFLLLCVSLLSLLSGCGVSDRAETSGGGGGGTGTIDLQLSSPNGNVVVADGRSTLPIRIVVTRSTGGGLANVPVVFRTTAGTLSPAPTVRVARASSESVARQEGETTLTLNTDGNGVAAVLLTSSTRVGVATVTAEAQGFRTNIPITFIAGAPARLQLAVSPASVAGGATSTVTATVTDANGNLTTDVSVVFAVETNTSGGSVSADGQEPDANGRVTVRTDDQGQAQATYTAGLTTGSDTLRAQTTTGNAVGTISVTVTPPAPGTVTAVNVASSISSVRADGQSSAAIHATVVGASGALSGVLVSFTATAGTLSASQAPTDANGVASVNLLAPTTPGSAIVTATVGGISGNVTVSFVAGPATTVRLVATPTTVNARATSTIQITVTDANSNPVTNQAITLAISTNVSGATLSALTGTTDTNGRLTVTYTAGGTPGVDTVQASASGTTSATGTVSVTVLPPDPNTVTAVNVASSASSVSADGQSSVAIRATAAGAAGNVPGVTVTFTTTAGSLSAAQAVTDANGVATVNLIAPTTLGSATVTATVGANSGTVSVSFIAGTATSVQFVVTPATVSVQGTAMVQITVTDANNNPASEQTVTLDVPTNVSGSTLSVLTGTTDTNGRLTVTYTAGTTPGVDTIRGRVTGGTGMVSIVVTPLAGAGRIDLLVSSPQLDSSGTDTITLTALVRNTTNNVVAGVDVSFAADSGAIQVTSGTTGPNGIATALLSTPGDPSNRRIAVAASAGTLSSLNEIEVTGTTITISGAGALVQGGTTRLQILLRDSSGAGIPSQNVTVRSLAGNRLSATSVRTDTTGQAFVTLTADVPGSDTLEVEALGATGSTALTVSADNFVFTTPTASTQIPLNTARTVTIHWDEGGTPRVGQTINFFITRGTLSAPSAVTDASGDASVTVSADNAGPAVISAIPSNATSPSSQLSVTFVATSVDTLITQAAPATVGVNAPGSTTQQSVITAVARDAQGNLVANQPVVFSLTDVSGGQIFPASVSTDAFGRASTVYTAGSAVSAQDGVVVTARAGSVTGVVTLTVAQQAFFVTLGTGNEVLEPTTTTYEEPFVVVVTDSNGNPVPNQLVEINVVSTRYQKGFYTLAFDASGSCVGWVKELTITGNADPDDTDQACNNEDVNQNGLLDAGEDHNSNGFVDPGNVVSVPASVTTNASGLATFVLTYAQQFTWVEVALEARTRVAGSEALDRATFFLPGIVTDFNDCQISPPGAVSPYGTAITCACDEGVDPSCLNVAGPVTFTPPSITLPSSGGSVVFRVAGGARQSYDVSTTGGTLRTSGGATGTLVRLNLGESLTLTTTFAQAGTIVSVLATDTVTGIQGSALVTQQAP